MLEIEQMNLSSSFKSVSNIPVPSKQPMTSKQKGKANKIIPPATGKLNATVDSLEESKHLAVVWAAVSQDPKVGDAQRESQSWAKIVATYN